MSQRVALAALQEAGSDWVRERVRGLNEQREIVWAALEPLHKDSMRSKGSLYFFAKLPQGVDDNEVRCLSFTALYSQQRVCFLFLGCSKTSQGVQVCSFILFSSRN